MRVAPVTPARAMLYWDQLYDDRPAPDREPPAELVAAIGEHGVTQPLVVRPMGRGAAPAPVAIAAAYRIVHGVRRWRAVVALIAAERMAPDATLPCRIEPPEEGKGACTAPLI